VTHESLKKDRLQFTTQASQHAAKFGNTGFITLPTEHHRRNSKLDTITRRKYWSCNCKDTYREIAIIQRLSMAINFDPLLANKIDPLGYR